MNSGELDVVYPIFLATAARATRDLAEERQVNVYGSIGSPFESAGKA